MNANFVEKAKAMLEANGFVVLREKSYRQAQERQRVAEALRQNEVEHGEHTRAWAVNCLDEERRLRDRCEYLYGLAARHGASDEELCPWKTEVAPDVQALAWSYLNDELPQQAAERHFLDGGG